MSFFVNDISWGQISLCNLINNWIPGVFAFLMGMIFNRIIERRSLRKTLKNELLEIFIPTFNTGQKITGQEAFLAYKKLKTTLNTYAQVYPNILKKTQTDTLRKVLNEGFIKDGQVNECLLDPERMIKAIRKL